ncbi:MAG: phage major capsid protein [Gemmobacter sp.]
MADSHESLTRQAEFRATSYDAERRTFTAVIATATPVLRHDAQGPFLEVLPADAFDLSAQSLPVLDSHNTATVRAVLGRTFSIRREGDVIVAEVQLSSADDVGPVGQRIADGTLRGVSLGYVVAGWKAGQEGGKRIKTSTRVMPREVTLTSNPADPNSGVRQKEAAMADDNDELTREDLIATLGRACGLPDTWGDDLAEDATPEQVRAAAREAMQARQAPRVRVIRSHDDPATITRRKADALAFRMAGGTLPEDAREFAPMGFRDLAADALTRAGESVRGLSADDILTRAGQHTTSDFPLVVSNAANKVALTAYQAAESPLKQLARQRTLPNFKDSTSIRLGELGKLEELTETGEITATSRAESGEVMRLSTFARRLDVSRKLQIDDDLNLFGDMTAALGQAAAQTEADIMVDLIVGNPDLRDGDPVFDAGRGNVSTAAALSVTSLGLTRRALRERKGLDGVTPISAHPAFLLVGPELETLAEQVLSSIYAADVSDVNPFAGKLRLLVEPRLSGNDWYVFADPARLATLQCAYLSSAQGVQIQRQEAWNTLGLSFRAFLDFGAGWVDWRGAQYNAGA